MPAAPKPTKTLDWYPTDPDDIVEPGTTDKERGHRADDEPEAEWFNFAWDLASQWYAWLRDLLPYGELAIGGAIIDSAANALLPRVKFPIAVASSFPRTALISPLLLDTLGLGWTIYIHNPDDLGMAGEIVVNGYYSAADSKWHRRAGGKHTSIYRFAYDGTLKVYRRESGSASPWTDTYDAAGWETTVLNMALASTAAVGTWSIPTLIVNSLSVLTQVTGDLTIGDDLTVTDDAAVGGDLSVAGSIAASTLTTTGDMSIGDDLSVADDATVTGTVTAGAVAAGSASISGEVTAGSGIYTGYLDSYLDGYTGPGPTVFVWSALGDGAADARFYIVGEGRVRRWRVWSGAQPDDDVTLTLSWVSPTNVVTVLDTIVLPDTQTLVASGDIDEPFPSTGHGYLRIRATSASITAINMMAAVEVVQ